MAGTAAAGVDRLAGALFAGLIAACFAAFFITQRLKHTPTAVQAFKLTPFFSPTPAGHIKQEHISFRLDRSEGVTVSILDSSGNEVATLVRNLFATRYKQLSLRWNGHLGVARSYRLVPGPDGRPSVVPANKGPLARPGDYRVRVSLRSRRRAILSPRSFTLAKG
jgi:hypothetical protein